MRNRTAGRLIWSFAFVGSITLFPISVSACSDGQFESHVTRSRAVATVPAGAIQLQVDVPYNEDELRSLDEGKVTLPVKRVLHGSFEQKSIELDFNNMTSCDYFGPTGKGLYVVVNPWLYDEGDPVKDVSGNPIVDVIRYNWSVDPSYQGKLATFPDGPADVLKERKMFSCVRRGHETEQAIVKCTAAKNPDSLYRPTSTFVLWLGAALTVMGAGAFAVRKMVVAKNDR